MATELERRVGRLEAVALGSEDFAREWLAGVQDRGSLEEYARGQALELDEPDDATRIIRRIRAALPTSDPSDVCRVIADTLFLRDVLLELDRSVIEATDRLGVRLHLVALARADWRPTHHNDRSWEWVAGELIGEARRVDRLVTAVGRLVGGHEVLVPSSADAWIPVRDFAEAIATWLPPPNGRIRARNARRADAEFRALLDQCRARTLDHLGYPELATRVLRSGLLGFDGSSSYGHRRASRISADGRWLIFTPEEVARMLTTDAYADWRLEADDPVEPDEEDRDGGDEDPEVKEDAGP